MVANTHQPLEQIRIVLLETSHPGNIGSVCRAMWTMGLTNLYLVDPKHYPHPQVAELASGADRQVVPRVVNGLEEALADCALVVGTTARPRQLSPEVLPARASAAMAVEMASQQQPVAIVFGPERTGLDNTHIQHCHHLSVIDGNAAYCSLNLAAAVQIVCYELRQASHASIPQPLSQKVQYADQASVEGLHQHLQRTLTALGFLQPNNPRRLLPRLRRFFNRTRLEQMEINFLRGMLAAVDKHIQRAKETT